MLQLTQLKYFNYVPSVLVFVEYYHWRLGVTLEEGLDIDARQDETSDIIIQNITPIKTIAVFLTGCKSLVDTA